MKTTMRILPLLALVLALAAPSLALAQEDAEGGDGAAPTPAVSSTTGTMTALVLDFDRRPLEGARFLVQARTGNASYEWVTGPDGRLEEVVPAGDYSMQLVIRGVNIQQYDQVRIDAGSVTEAEVDLSSAPADTRRAIEDAWAEREASESAVDLFATGREALTARDYDRAIQFFTRALAAQPTQHVIMANLAEAYNGARRYPEAIEQYQAALALVPEEAVYHRNLASIYALAGQSEAGEASVAEAARLDPPNGGRSYFQIGAAYLNSGNMQGASNAFLRATELDPQLADAYYYLGLSYLGDAERLSEAIPLMQRYLELAPDGPNAESARGIIEQLGSVN